MDGFRNFFGPAEAHSPQAMGAPAEALLVDRASMLTLTKGTPPLHTSPHSSHRASCRVLVLPAGEMAVLVGGLRVLDANTAASPLGVLTTAPGTLTNDYFVNLLDMATVWTPTDDPNVYEGKDRASGRLKWKSSRVDLIFGSNSQLRAVAEHYACCDSKFAFVADFVAAWTKVMNLDRFDLEQLPASNSSLRQLSRL